MRTRSAAEIGRTSTSTSQTGRVRYALGLEARKAGLQVMCHALDSIWIPLMSARAGTIAVYGSSVY